MAKFRALMLWTDAWIADTTHLTRCERGTYHDLLVLMWRSPGCSVPNDDAWLAKHLKMTITEVEIELRPIISEFCKTDGNRIWQKRLMHEFKWSKKRTKVATDNANLRWNKEKPPSKADATQHCSTVTVTVPVPKKEEERAKALSLPRRKSRTALPSDWKPDLEFSEQPEFDKFCDHARAQGRLCADWPAAWRNWKRRAPEFTPRNGSWKDERQKENYDVSKRLREYLSAGPDESRQGGDADDPPPWRLPLAKPA